VRLLAAVLLCAVTPAAALAWAGPPAAAPPKPATTAGPLPAWAETASRASWLAYSAYCWKTACADYLPPASRPDLPVVTIVRGASIRFHFGFRPTSISVTVLGSTTATAKLAAAQVVTWKPRAAGVFTLALKAPPGSASYAGRIRFR
jgi:hypothetical protein